MHKTILGVAALALALVAAPLRGQRQLRVGPTYSSLSLQDLSGKSHVFSSFGGSAALITGDDGETGITVARYNDLSTDGAVRRLTLFALDSYYYPIGTRGVAPYAATELGLARVTESAAACLPESGSVHAACGKGQSRDRLDRWLPPWRRSRWPSTRDVSP